MTNAQVIELCGTLGIGVKGHSSGMPEPQADRVRRKAESEGLVNEVKEEKPAAKKPAQLKNLQLKNLQLKNLQLKNPY